MHLVPLNRILAVVALSFCVFLVGCAKDNPGKWPIEKIEADLKDHFELVDISSTPVDGGYTSTGKTAEGESFTIEVQQFPDQSKYTWDASSDRGTLDEGYYELK